MTNLLKLNHPKNAKLEQRPVRFVFNAVSRHAVAHIVILLSVLTGVSCSVASQYAVKHVVDVLARHDIAAVWAAFALLAGLIAADNLSWRLGGWVAARSFVEVTGDIRRYLFDHTLGHSPGFFTTRRAGMLAGRISATGNAVFRIENLTVWNVLPPMIVVASLGFSAAVLSAAALSFLGLGAQPPTSEWGLMLATGRNYITRAPWLLVGPGVAIFVTVMAFNVFGDGVRDLLDPRQRQRTR